VIVKSVRVSSVVLFSQQLFHVSVVMDEILGEEDRLTIIIGQRTTTPKSAPYLGKITDL
jgi:hypothetical protein